MSGMQKDTASFKDFKTDLPYKGNISIFQSGAESLDLQQGILPPSINRWHLYIVSL